MITELIYHDAYFEFGVDELTGARAIAELRVYMRPNYVTLALLTEPVDQDGRLVNPRSDPNYPPVLAGRINAREKIRWQFPDCDQFVVVLPRLIKNERLHIREQMLHLNKRSLNFTTMDRDDLIRYLNRPVPEWVESRLYLQYTEPVRSLRAIEPANQWHISPISDDDPGYDLVYRLRRDGSPVIAMRNGVLETWFPDSGLTESERRELYALERAYLLSQSIYDRANGP